ncbi:MAG TPA: histidine phosphatase family protein [Dehalococcoidia bacterium]|nr:histidine phosphatase family protein [Dehalococcoidia bacterium]
MTRLVVVRHGRTEWNRVERFRGRVDIDLDEVGIKQAEAAAERIAKLQAAAVYSSPLRRAMTTAEIIARRSNLEAKLLPGLIDIDFGDWQGLSPDEVAARNNELYSKWLGNPHLVEFPGGESLAMVRERASSAVDSLITQHPAETVILVSHKVVCQVLVLILLGLDNSHFWEITQDVCAINLFEVRNGVPSALFLNDTCHLKDVE